MNPAADPALVEKWIRGWALTREKAPPEPIPGGWRVHVGESDQVARYVFAQPSEQVSALARLLPAPLTPIKVCAPPEAVAPLLLAPWIVERTASLMTGTLRRLKDDVLSNLVAVATERTNILDDILDAQSPALVYVGRDGATLN